MSLDKKQQDATSDQQKHIQRPIMRIVLFTTKVGSLVSQDRKALLVIVRNSSRVALFLLPWQSL